jgi:hypothetical protein
MCAHHPASITKQPVHAAFDAVASANHCQAGAVIALSGAATAALAQATANTTLADGAPSSQEAREMQRAMAQARARLLAIADEDARAIGTFVALREAGQALQGYELLCEGPREIAQIAIAAGHAMSGFRAHVGERGKDDLEFALTLMVGAARAAAQLLDSNLRIWPLPELVARFDAEVTRLLHEVDALTPRARIR